MRRLASLLSIAALTLAIAGGASARHRPHDRDDKPPGPAGGPGTNWENPVSYTQLNVYKRQVSHQRAVRSTWSVRAKSAGSTCSSGVRPRKSAAQCSTCLLYTSRCV